MLVEKETIVERPVERETVVETGGGGGAALIGGVLVALLLAVLFFWIFNGGHGGPGSVTIEAPKITTTP
jgi:hypothetical protein